MHFEDNDDDDTYPVAVAFVSNRVSAVAQQSSARSYVLPMCER